MNKGTNFLFNPISFISNSVAVVLQLALAIDYAIILCHRYTEEPGASGGPGGSDRGAEQGHPGDLRQLHDHPLRLGGHVLRTFRTGYDWASC